MASSSKRKLTTKTVQNRTGNPGKKEQANPANQRSLADWVESSAKRIRHTRPVEDEIHDESETNESDASIEIETRAKTTLESGDSPKTGGASSGKKPSAKQKVENAMATFLNNLTGPNKAGLRRWFRETIPLVPTCYFGQMNPIECERLRGLTHNLVLPGWTGEWIIRELLTCEVYTPKNAAKDAGSEPANGSSGSIRTSHRRIQLTLDSSGPGTMAGTLKRLGGKEL